MILAEFLNPGRLWLLLVVALMAVGYVATQFMRRKHVVTFTNVDLLDQLAPKRPGWRRHAVASCYLAAAVFGVIAVARPVHRTVQQSFNNGRILLVFDVSLSMQSTDVKPSRLDAAKQAAKDFVDQVDPHVEVGLIDFDGTVDVRVSPTLNHTQVSNAIDSLQLGEGTAIGDALSVATDVIGPPDKATPNQPAGAVVLMSDGETTVGRPTADGAQTAADAKIPVYSIAFGTADGTVVDPTTGDTVAVPVNNNELKGVADTTGAKFFKAPTADALKQAYAEISKNLNAGVGDPIQVTDELTWQYIAVALVLLAIGWVLGLVLLRGLL